MKHKTLQILSYKVLNNSKFDKLFFKFLKIIISLYFSNTLFLFD